MATCKAFLKDKNKKGEFKIWVKYTHQSQWKPFSTGITILPEHFNSKDGKVLETHPTHSQYNAIIHALSAHISSLASSLESKFINPTPDQVRLVYDKSPFIQNRRTLKKLAESSTAKAGKNVPPKKAIDWNEYKNISYQEFLKTDISQLDFKRLMQKYGSPSITKK